MMTFAQFRRMKPKYQKRLVLALLTAFLLFILLMVGISLGVKAIRIQLNTTELKGVTSDIVLQKENMALILSTVKQSDATMILVMDSEMTLRGDGKITQVTVNFVNLVDNSAAENWRLVSNEKKTTLHRINIQYENMSYLRMRKLTFNNYYPALSRVISPELMGMLEETAPVGIAGSYTFVDAFGDNVSPSYKTQIQEGLLGIWVPKAGGVSPFSEDFVQPAPCAPTVVTVKATNTEKSKGKKVVFEEEAEKFVVLFEAATY